MQAVIGLVRVLMPRYAARGQYEAMVAHSIRKAYQLGALRADQQLAGLKVVEGTWDDVLRHVRKGTVVAVPHAHLLAEPSLRGKLGGTRQDFWAKLDAIEAKGAVLWELYTGLRTDKRSERDALTRATIETLARGRHKTRKSDKRGRPPKTWTDVEWEQARAAWESKRLKTWDDVEKRLPKGMTKWRAWEEFGPREVETA